MASQFQTEPEPLEPALIEESEEHRRDRRWQLTWSLGVLSICFAAQLWVNRVCLDPNRGYHASHILCCMQPFVWVRGMKNKFTHRSSQDVIYPVDLTPVTELQVLAAEIAKVQLCPVP